VKSSEVPVGERQLNVEDSSSLTPVEVADEANRCYNCSCLAVNTSGIGLALVAQVTEVCPEGSRTVPAAEFFDTLDGSLGTGEVVTEIRLPRLLAGARQVFLKHRVQAAVAEAIPIGENKDKIELTRVLVKRALTSR
jgi:CO/xanthine dehydrogenase FAD-binding subunit